MNIIYGNKYVTNEETVDKEITSIEDLMVAILDFLETKENDFKNGNEELPNDWFNTIFWKEK